MLVTTAQFNCNNCSNVTYCIFKDTTVTMVIFFFFPTARERERERDGDRQYTDTRLSVGSFQLAAVYLSRSLYSHAYFCD